MKKKKWVHIHLVEELIPLHLLSLELNLAQGFYHYALRSFSKLTFPIPIKTKSNLLQFVNRFPSHTYFWITEQVLTTYLKVYLKILLALIACLEIYTVEMQFVRKKLAQSLIIIIFFEEVLF